MLVGVDRVWCVSDEGYSRYTERGFPEWMYDDNPWNDYLAHFDFHTLEQAARQSEAMLGMARRRQLRDFLPDDSEYDPIKARTIIWGSSPPPHEPAVSSFQLEDAGRRYLESPAIRLMRETLAS